MSILSATAPNESSTPFCPPENTVRVPQQGADNNVAKGWRSATALEIFEVQIGTLKGYPNRMALTIIASALP